MPQKDFEFKAVKAGDPITDTAWNDIGMQVMRLSGVPGEGSISTGAGVFTRRIPPAATTDIAYFEINQPLYRTTNAIAAKKTWTASGWVNGSDSATIYGDFSTGYWFVGDVLPAIYSSAAERWYALGCGQTLVRGVLDSNIEASGDKISVSVYEWSSPNWGDTGVDIRARETLGIASPVASSTNVWCSWHEQSQLWYFTGAACG